MRAEQVVVEPPENYVAWTALNLLELRQLLADSLARSLRSFKEEAADLHDTDERFATRDYLSGLEGTLRAWCSHFDLPFACIQGYDARCFPGAAVGPMSWHTSYIDYDSLASMLATGVQLATADSSPLYRPQAVELATDEILKWLRVRPHFVDRVTPRTFERLIADVLSERGWQVELTKHTRDGGYDVVAACASVAGLTMKVLVECKLYDLCKPVGLAMVDRLMGAVSREHADAGWIVTNSRFTSTVWREWELRVGRDLQLVDRCELLEWLRSR